MFRKNRLLCVICLLVAAFSIVTLYLSSNSLFYNIYVWVKYCRIHGQEAFLSPGGWAFYRPNLSCILKPWIHTRHNKKTICALNDTLNEMGIALIVVPVPEKEEIIHAYSPFSVAIVCKQKLRFLKRLRESGVHVIDLTMPFIKDSLQEQLYRKTDTHWDQRGISSGAKIISSNITSLLPQSSIAEYQLKDTVIAEPCDMACMLRDSTPVRRKGSMVLNADNSYYKEKPSSEIMIFGDSFIGVNRQFNAGLGAHIAYFTKQPNFTYMSFGASSRGPRLLLTYLKNQKKMPKFIVWVFASRALFYKIETLKR